MMARKPNIIKREKELCNCTKFSRSQESTFSITTTELLELQQPITSRTIAMPYHGPKLDAVPEAVTMWSWLFDRQNKPGEPNEFIRRRGFRDAATDSYVSFQTIKEQAIHCASALAVVYGLKAQEKVAVLAQNSISYTVAVFAAERLGATVTALPSMAMSQDIAHYLAASGARIVFYDQSTAAEVASAWKGFGAPPYTLVSLDGMVDDSTAPSLHRLVLEGSLLDEKAQTPAWTVPQGQSNKNVCAFLAFSSGTTGKPKAVCLKPSWSSA